MAIGFNKETAIGAGLGGAGGAVAGGLFGGSKKPSIDISQQLAQLQANAEKNRGVNKGLFDTTSGNLSTFQGGAKSALDQARTDFTGAKTDYLGAVDQNTNEAKDLLRKNLYGDTFNGMPDALRSIREASAAGGGLETGSYQKAVGDFGVKTAQTLGQGERDIQMAGLNTKQDAQKNVFNTFNALSSKLSDQQLGVLTKVLDTGDANAVRQATTAMGLNDNETQGIIDLLNFKQTGEMAQSNADEANKYALLTSLIGGGAKIAGGRAAA